MERVKDFYKIFVMMFSEIIWIYYTIVMFTSIEWNQPAFFDLTWFAAAGVMGYTFNVLLAQRINYLFLFLANVSVVGFMIFLNWISIVPHGVWGFGIGVSIGLSFIFLRSTRLVYHKPARYEILRRFEGNVICYTFFVLVFSINNWINEMFHLFFICAIVSSLMGMILTLQNHEEAEDNQKTRIIKVGQSGWFAGVTTILLISIPLFSLALFLPAVNRALYLTGIAVWESLKWLVVKIGSFIFWFLSLFPEPELAPIPDAPAPQTNMLPKAMEETMHSLPMIWIIAAGAVLLIVLVIWLFSRLMIKMQFPKSLKPKHMLVTKESWWVHLKRNLKSYLRYLNLKWRMRFPHFYYYAIYWYYHQVVRWGKKNGFPKDKSETSQEYVKRIIDHIPEKESNFSFKGQNYQLSELLQRLNKDYQATYYGQKVEISGEGEYQFLINHLQSIRLTGSSTWGSSIGRRFLNLQK